MWALKKVFPRVEQKTQRLEDVTETRRNAGPFDGRLEANVPQVTDSAKGTETSDNVAQLRTVESDLPDVGGLQQGLGTCFVSQRGDPVRRRDWRRTGSCDECSLVLACGRAYRRRRVARFKGARELSHGGSADKKPQPVHWTCPFGNVNGRMNAWEELYRQPSSDRP